jgi:ATP-dependent RNA helicase DHX37/DHR1
VTHQERMEKDEDLKIKHILQGRIGKRKRGISGIANVMNDSDSASEDKGLSGSDTDLNEIQSMSPKSFVEAVEMDKLPTVEDRPPTEAPIVVGNALRRNDDGTVAAPIVKTRPRKVSFTK